MKTGTGKRGTMWKKLPSDHPVANQKQALESTIARVSARSWNKDIPHPRTNDGTFGGAPRLPDEK